MLLVDLLGEAMLLLVGVATLSAAFAAFPPPSATLLLSFTLVGGLGRAVDPTPAAAAAALTRLHPWAALGYW